MLKLHRWFAGMLLSVIVAPLPAGILEDRGIEDAINRSVIFQEVLIDRSMVQLYVRYGFVEIRGQVADEFERDLLTYMVNAIPDVRKVENHLFVDSPGRRDSARWRAVRLRSLLAMCSDVDLRGTKLEFTEGNWRLAGQVADESSRSALAATLHALNLADTSRGTLNLALDLAGPGSKSTPRLRMDDASIAALVRGTLDLPPALGFSRAQVSCQQGKVRLQGSVASESSRLRAGVIAARARGVLAVENELTVLPES